MPTPSQKFLKAQTNLPSSLFSIKKGDEDWFTFVSLRNEHKWCYSTLTGATLQAATNTLNGAIATQKAPHAVQQCLKELEGDVIRRISEKDYYSSYSYLLLFQTLTIAFVLYSFRP